MTDPDTWAYRLFEAINAGQSERARALLESKPADQNIDEPRWFGHTLLTQACALGEDAIVELLLAVGANPSGHDDEGDFPLDSAAHGGYGEVFQRLLNAGADPENDPEGRLGLIGPGHACWEALEDALACKRAAKWREALIKKVAPTSSDPDTPLARTRGRASKL